jgi:hypothetical protein
MTLAALLRPAAFGDKLPTATDVENLSQACAAAFNAFITESFLPRAKLQYSGRFTDPQDARNISALAKKTAATLAVILQSQELIRRDIEQYDGDDWDRRYGNTSLWRVSIAAAQQTQWRICVVDYHHGIASTGKKKELLLRYVIAQTNKKTDFHVNEKKLLNTRARWAAATEKKAENTIGRLDSLIASSGIDNEVFYQAVIMRMKLSSRINAQQLSALAENLKKGKLKNNYELLLKLAMEELKLGGDSIIRSIAARHRSVTDFAGRVILDDIISNAGNRQLLNMTLKTKTPAETQFAALIAIKEKHPKYAAAFKQMSSIAKFQNDVVYLAAAQSCCKTEPLKAIDFYLQAIKKTKVAKNTWLKYSAAKIAHNRARLAYSLYYDDSKYFKTAKEAIELYLLEAANDEIEDKTEHNELAYIYASMLIEAGDLVKAVEALAKVIEKTSQIAPPNDAPRLAAALTAEIIEDIDEYEQKTDDFATFVGTLNKLVFFSQRSLKHQSQIELFEKRGMEISIIQARKGSERIATVQSLLKKHAKGKDDDIDWMRCRARLHMKQERFAEALRIWTSIANARRPRSLSGEKSKKWWRAKYYALKCYSKIADPKNNDLARAIELLTSTNKNIPEFWKKKINELEVQ